MTIQYKRNETNVAQQLSQLSQLPGDAGLNMLRAKTQLEQFNLLGVGRRNLLINGDMKINQRGFNLEDSEMDYFTADRWRVHTNGAGDTFTTQLSNDVPPQHEFGNSIITTCNEGVSLNNWDHESATYYHEIKQRIETDNTSHLMWGQPTALPLTISFWVKANHTGTYSAGLRVDYENDSDASLDYHYAAAQSFTIEHVDTWEYKTMSFHPPRNLIGDKPGVYNVPLLTAFISLGAINGSATNNDDGILRYGQFRGLNSKVGGITDALTRVPGRSIQFTGMQLEASSFATPFEYRTQSEQLFACQRYYQKQEGVSLYLPEGQTYSRWLYYFNQPMRTTPTIRLFQHGTPALPSSPANWPTIGSGATRDLINAHAAPGTTHPGFTADADF